MVRFLPLLLGPLCAVATINATQPDLSLALQHYETRNYAEARRLLESLRNAHPADGTIIHHLGLVAQREKDWTAAVRWHEEAVRLDPAQYRYWMELGRAQGAKASAESSLEGAAASRASLEKAVELAPQNFEARAALADFFRLAPPAIGGSLERAFAQAEALRGKHPAAANRLRCSLLLRQKRYSEINDDCEAILRTSPDDYAALFYLGHAASFSGQNAERGRETLRRCLTLPPPPGLPGPSTIWCRIGALERKVGREAEARVAYEEALKIDPANREALEGLGRP